MSKTVEERIHISPLRTVVLTALTLVAFASNSVLTRLALGDGAIDAASYTTIRIITGSLTLLVISSWVHRGKSRPASAGAPWTTGVVLFLYAVPFSFAYLSLTAGTGALILFGAVQLTMMIAALRGGERPHLLQWLGLGMALAGLVYLVLPGLGAPSPAGAALMALAGVAWGRYSLIGRGGADPLQQTTGAFVRALPFVLIVSLLAFQQAHVSTAGVLLASASGALASGVGYTVWYTALSGLTATRAAIVQLLVPILAALGGVMFIGESITLRLIVSAVIVLGGVALALLGRERTQHGLLLDTLLEDVTPESLHEPIDTGDSVGREAW